MRSENMTSWGCPSNPSGAALLLPQPTARNQLDTPFVDLGLGGTRRDGGTSTGASQEVNAAAAVEKQNPFAHSLVTPPHS